MICFPNAKINIGLRITEKRDDGFHNIESCFYPIPWYDILEIIPAKELSFYSNGIDIPGDLNDNLCIKAYNLVKKDYNIPAVSIFLQKIIPIGAGMGGGSSDAAYTLKSLNDLFNLKITETQLESYAKKLGSDCAFFIKNKPVIAFEKGDVFENCSINLAGKQLLTIYPNTHVSTKEAYAGVSPKIPQKSLSTILNTDILNWKEEVSNDFEKSIFPKYPLLEQIKAQLYSGGALYASMTGSGSTVFVIFESEINTQLLFDKSFVVRKMVLN